MPEFLDRVENRAIGWKLNDCHVRGHFQLIAGVKASGVPDQCGVFVVGARYGRWPSVAAAILSVLMFDILFTEPYYTVIVEDSQYAVTFLVMLSAGLVTSTLLTLFILPALYLRFGSSVVSATSSASVSDQPALEMA